MTDAHAHLEEGGRGLLEWQSLPAREGDSLGAVRGRPGIHPGEDPRDVRGLGVRASGAALTTQQKIRRM